MEKLQKVGIWEKSRQRSAIFCKPKWDIGQNCLSNTDLGRKQALKCIWIKNSLEVFHRLLKNAFCRER